jgi:hypothetical protein
MWIGSPHPDDLSMVFQAAGLSLSEQLVWFSNAHCDGEFRGDSTVEQLQYAGSHCESIRASVSALNNNIQTTCECLAANMGSLEGRGRILDAVRQREPQQLVIWLSATEDKSGSDSGASASVPDVSLLGSWIIGVTVLVSGAIDLMRCHSHAKIVIVLPRVFSADQAHAFEAHAAEAYLRTWVAASQVRHNAADVTLSIIRLPTDDA